jgi:hypothetical protein
MSERDERLVRAAAERLEATPADVETALDLLEVIASTLPAGRDEAWDCARLITTAIARVRSEEREACAGIVDDAIEFIHADVPNRSTVHLRDDSRRHPRSRRGGEAMTFYKPESVTIREPIAVGTGASKRWLVIDDPKPWGISGVRVEGGTIEFTMRFDPYLADDALAALWRDWSEWKLSLRARVNAALDAPPLPLPREE